MLRFPILLFLFATPSQAGNPQILPYCQPLSFSTTCLSIVCVCNSTFCDEIESPGVLGYDEVQLYTSSEDGDRVLRTTLSFDTAARAEYTLGRVTMGATDFSVRDYSYDDVTNDFNLDNFSLANEDVKYKIPLIKSANEVSSIDIKLFGSPWLAPSWMREFVNSEMKLKGETNGEYYETWAKYYVKFVNAYNAQNIDVWGLSVQNEPNAGYGRLANLPNITMAYTPIMQRDFIKLNLGPALRSSNVTKDLKLIVMDDQRDFVSIWANTIFGDEETDSYADGIGVQWYSDSAYSTATLESVHNRYPKKFILGTEAGFTFNRNNVGCWDQAEQYAYDIISDMNKFVAGWIDINLFVDTNGGPNKAELSSNAAIIVDSSSDQFYKQPLFYIMAHFSKFVRPEAHRVALQMPGGAYGSAFVNAWGQRVLIVLNKSRNKLSFSVSDTVKQGKFLNIQMKPRSIFTAVWDK